MKKQITVTALLSFLLMLAVWLLYSQTGGFEFLRLDDHDYTFRCLFVRDGLSWANVCEAFANMRHAAIWMPATYISYMAGISLFGPGMGAHHLVNVAIHAFNAVLFFLLLLSLARNRAASAGGAASRRVIWLAFIAAAFWALHPQRVEAVAWIAGRKELLCAFFTLLGLLCWLRAGAFRIAGTIACCALACMSKPTGMCFPFLLLAVEVLVNSEFGIRNSEWKGIFIPLFVIAVLTGAIAVYSQTHPEGMGERMLFTASLPWRILNAAVATGLYIYHMAVPAGIHLDYAATPGSFPIAGLKGLVTLAIVMVALAVLAWRVRTSRRAIVAFSLFFFAALAPTLGIFGSFGEHARADRFFYLPSMAVVGFLVLGSWFLVRGSWFMVHGSWLLVYGGVAGVLSILSHPVICSYKNDYTAFMRTLQFEPENGRALAHVASEECARFGRIDKGIELYRRSQAVRPRDDTAAQLAYTLALRALSADHAEIRRLCAKFACDHSLDRKGMALEALGMTAMRQRKWTEAIACFEDSIKAPARFYSADDARLRLGACYANARRSDDAIRIFEPLTQSPRTDIATRASQFLQTLKRNPSSVIFF